MTLEQCKQLKEWGLPQDKSYFNYWDWNGEIQEVDPIRVSDYFTGGEKLICAIPDLEQLLEFANEKLKKQFDLNNSIIGEWEIHLCNEPRYIAFSDPDPKVAVYKLLEKKLGEAR